MYRDLTLIRDRLGSGAAPSASAFDLVTAIRLQMLRTQESLVTDAAARAAELEKRVMGIDPVKAETVLNGLFSLRHDLQTIRTNAAQTHELYVHLIDTLDSQEGLMPLDIRRLNDLRLGFSHLRNTVDLQREYLQEVLDLLQTRVSTELNRFVRKITAWGTIGIGWTVIVGVYGMNFPTSRSRLALRVRVRFRPDGAGRDRSRCPVPAARLALTLDEVRLPASQHRRPFAIPRRPPATLAARRSGRPARARRTPAGSRAR